MDAERIELMYGDGEQEQLDVSEEDIIEHILDECCEKAGESFDTIADRIEWPIRVYEYRRMAVSDGKKKWLSNDVLMRVIEALEEEYGDPDSWSQKISQSMEAAAKTFVDTVANEFIVWACEQTGEYTDWTREMAKTAFGDEDDHKGELLYRTDELTE